MKMVLISFLLVVSSTLAFGQSIDDRLIDLGGKILSAGQAKGEKDKLSKAAAKYNADQPSVSLVDARTVIRAASDQNSWRYDDRNTRLLKPGFTSMVTAVGGRPVWDDKDIDDESASRIHHRGNDEVNQTTLPGKGRVSYRNTILEYEFIDFEKSSDSELAIGRWWNQNRFRMSRETAYFGLTLTVRDGDTGEVLAVYKTLGSASTADNVGAQIAGGFFSNSVSYSSNGNSEEDRRFRAMENALREMGLVVKQKCR